MDRFGRSQPVRLFWLLRAGELLGALMFLPLLPWWQPMLWFALVAGAGTWAHARMRRRGLHQRSLRQRRALDRRDAWLSGAALGTACVLLYQTGADHGHQALLAGYLIAVAGVVAMWGVRDVARTGVAVALILCPTMLRFMFEGLTERRPMVLTLGGAGMVATAIIVYAATLYAQRVMRESALRMQAERAADALTELGLAKSRFLASVSHDLRQPVHAIGLYVDTLTRSLGPDAPADARRAVNGIRQSWHALDDLLGQVLDLTRMDTGALRASITTVELGPLLRAVVLQHSATAERAGVRIVVLDGAPAARHVQADELMLRRVLSNLLDNAIKFSPPGGCIALTVRPGARVWRIQVRDAGPGIAVEEHDNVFQEFVQIDNPARSRQQGYGLGLTISRRFAQLMQGELTLRSRPEHGACFTLTLPRASAPALVERPDEVACEGPPSELPPERVPALAAHDIMLVEDDPLVADAMCQLLGSWGQNVRHIDNASRAWRERAFGQIAICDVRLPGGHSGVDLALKLRASGKEVFLLSGETDVALKARALANGLPLLTKPVSGAQMLALLQKP